MGDVAAYSSAEKLSYRLLGDAGWEAITLYDGEKEVWHRDLHAEMGRSQRQFRVRLSGARIKDRYRGAYWTGHIDVIGTPINGFSLTGADHPEQTVWRESHTQIGLRTDTNGDSDTVTVSTGGLNGATVRVHLEICSYIKVGDPLTPQPHTWAPVFDAEIDGKALLLSGKETFTLAGTELQVEIELVTEQPLPRDLRGDLLLSEINLPEKSEHALFISARQKDQSRIWTSALFLTR